MTIELTKLDPPEKSRAYTFPGGDYLVPAEDSPTKGTAP